MENPSQEAQGDEGQGVIRRDESFREIIEFKAHDYLEETSIWDGDTSCLATGTASDIGDDILQSSYSYEVEEGTSDIDQLSRIFNVLGNLTEEVWSGCWKLPDYETISFANIENPIGLEASLPNHSLDEVSLVEKLVCYDPANRATAMELLHDEYFGKEPLPVPISELRVPLTNGGQNGDSPGGWYDYNDRESDSDFDEFGPKDITTTSTGFSLQFS
ncbi:hypothetical protein GH714_024692 [Hevea brasiliensis]|uniref:Protein kinase domain-containing protein n=1 Tax=Hevea brasiliensis TaxID=3981 RepID=A0A6A6LTV8_HEVBR|nr:hypothetical protein GH714_024692 [Hevea brasiliensis]